MVVENNKKGQIFSKFELWCESSQVLHKALNLYPTATVNLASDITCFSSVCAHVCTCVCIAGNESGHVEGNELKMKKGDCNWELESLIDEN